ncbi:MAG: hypothetical protein K2K57_00360 [Oscillospiraceae bacterium]|nr:hypothetical protein [Oscillospiraceae bacterium]
MTNDNNVFVPIELPPEIMAQMPRDLTLMEKREWRKKKAAELKAQQEVEAAKQTQAENPRAVSYESPPQAENPAVTANEASTADISSDEFQNTDISLDAVHTKSISKKSKPTKKQEKGAVKSSSDDLDTCNVRDIPKSVIHALKCIFPQAGKNADSLSAAVYIFTNGGCEISPKAMELVKSYNSDHAILALSEQMTCLNRVSHDMYKKLSAIELAVCYEIFDRRFGSKERRRSPRENEFMELGCLDLLYRLRVQTKELLQMDDFERGGSIFELSENENKSKN